MNTLMVNVLKAAIAAALVTGVSACNRNADAGATGAADTAASADAGVKYGKVVSVEVDGVMALVELEAGPFRVVAAITRDAVEELGLEPGVQATATVKATSVMVDRSDKE